MSADILVEWHPLVVGKMIKRAIGTRQISEAAKILGTSGNYLKGVIEGRHSVSAIMASRMHRIGLDGRQIFLKQAERSFEINWRYETGEIDRLNIGKRGSS